MPFIGGAVGAITTNWAASGIGNKVNSSNMDHADIANYKKFQEQNTGNGEVYNPNKDYGSTYKATSSNNIVDGLNKNGVNSSFANRNVIAQVNGIANYVGAVNQNQELLKKLQNGTLKKG